jgi:hypothetical protein
LARHRLPADLAIGGNPLLGFDGTPELFPGERSALFGYAHPP